MTLTKEILIDVLSQKAGMSGVQAKDTLETLLGLVKDSLEAGDSVKVSGFGKWDVKDKRKRRVRDPNTGDFIEISARRVVTFTNSDKLVEKMQDS